PVSADEGAAATGVEDLAPAAAQAARSLAAPAQRSSTSQPRRSQGHDKADTGGLPAADSVPHRRRRERRDRLLRLGARRERAHALADAERAHRPRRARAGGLAAHAGG